MFDKLIKNRKIVLLVISIFVIITVFSGTTYALFYNTKQSTYASSYTAGMISISGSGSISINNALPTDDLDGLETTPTSITITNDGDLPYRFNVKLLANDDTGISSTYIKVSVDGRMPFLLSEYENNIISSTELLLPGDTLTLEIRMWLDIDTPSSEIGKNFTGQITTDGYSENFAIDRVPASFEGDGTSSSPYLIKSIEDLIYFSNQVRNGTTYSGKYVRLVNSLNFNNNMSYVNPNDTSLFGDYNGDGVTEGIKTEVTSGRGFLPIGTGVFNTSASTISGNSFSGTFDGNDRQIQGLLINDSTGVHLGLFNYNTGTIRDLAVAHGNITGQAFLGGIVALNTGNIDNCMSNIEVNGTGTNTSDETLNSYVGGIASYNKGTVNLSKNVGLINTNVTIYNVGGIVGWNDNNGVISNCSNYGTILGRQSIGGIAGLLEESSLSNCDNFGLVYGRNRSSGLVGISIIGDISEVSNKGYIFGKQTVGGIVGHFKGSSLEKAINYATIYYTDNLDVDSSISSVYGIGGLIGDSVSNDNGSVLCEIYDAINYGMVGDKDNIDFMTKSQGVGGIAGIIQETELSRCGNYGEVNGWSGVGGIVGQSRGNIVQLSFNKADIIGERNVGGIVGLNMLDSAYYSTDADIINCFNSGDVIGKIYSSTEYNETTSPDIGGIVGNDTDNTNNSTNGFTKKIDLKNSYNVGNVSFTFEVDSCAGVAGRNYAMGSISYCYSATFSGSSGFSLVGQTSIVNGSSTFTDIINSYLYTANYMKTSEFLTELNTGLSENLWIADTTNINNGFPVLSWMVS